MTASVLAQPTKASWLPGLKAGTTDPENEDAKTGKGIVMQRKGVPGESLAKRPIRGPSTMAPARPGETTHGMHDEPSRQSRKAHLAEPAAAPPPVAA